MKKIIILLTLAAFTVNCSKGKTNEAEHTPEQILGELKIENIKVGTGIEIAKDNKIVMHYKGSLSDGTEFANSYKDGEPLLVLYGNSQLIPGMEQGMSGMRIGGIRKLTIPPHLGYGKRGLKNIPPNSTLIFEVKLVDILH
jgi:FKBP-type peptidyl-prolyl cis-trans isomerase